MAAPFDLPTSHVGEFQFLHLLANTGYLLLTFFLIVAILMNGKWYFAVVLICIFLMTNDVEQLFMCLLVIYTSTWRNVYASSLPIFEFGCLSLCH